MLPWRSAWPASDRGHGIQRHRRGPAARASDFQPEAPRASDRRPIRGDCQPLSRERHRLKFMADPPKEEPSLDPRTWAARKTDPDRAEPASQGAIPREATPETTSFNPKTWVSGAPTPPAPTRAP